MKYYKKVNNLTEKCSSISKNNLVPVRDVTIRHGSRKPRFFPHDSIHGFSFCESRFYKNRKLRRRNVNQLAGNTARLPRGGSRRVVTWKLKWPITMRPSAGYPRDVKYLGQSQCSIQGFPVAVSRTAVSRTASTWSSETHCNDSPRQHTTSKQWPIK